MSVFWGMTVKAFWNLVRSVLITVICGFLSVFVEAIIFGAILGDLAKLDFAPGVHFGVIVGLTALLSVFGTGFSFMVMGFDPFLGHGKRWEEAARKKKSPKAIVMYILLSVHLLLAIAVSVYVALTYPAAAEAYLNGTDSPLEKVCVIATVIPSQAIFFIGAMSHYTDSYFRCPRCKRMFTITSSLDSFNVREDYQYKTTTDNERIGSLNYDGREIAEVRADVTRGYQRKVTSSSAAFKCGCLYCGFRFGSVEKERKVGEWK